MSRFCGEPIMNEWFSTCLSIRYINLVTIHRLQSNASTRTKERTQSYSVQSADFAYRVCKCKQTPGKGHEDGWVFVSGTPHISDSLTFSKLLAPNASTRLRPCQMVDVHSHNTVDRNRALWLVHHQMPNVLYMWTKMNIVTTGHKAVYIQCVQVRLHDEASPHLFAIALFPFAL